MRNIFLSLGLVISGFAILASPCRSNIGAREIHNISSLPNPEGHNCIDIIIPSANFDFSITHIKGNAASDEIDWGDGTTSAITATTSTHRYAKNGFYRIFMPDSLTRFGCSHAASRVCIRELWASPAYNNVEHSDTSKRALRDLSNCKAMHFAASTIKFGGYCFQECTSLKNVFANDITYLGDVWKPTSVNCTLHASNLSGLTFIGMTAFRYCTVPDIKELYVNGRCTVKNKAFERCSFEIVEIPNAVASDDVQLGGYSTDLRRVVLPCVNWFNDSSARNIPLLEYFEVGTITKFGTYANYTFGDPSTGRNAPLVDGIRLTIKCRNTMASLIGQSSFPFCVSDFRTTKWICVDGYITYENGIWTQHAN